MSQLSFPLCSILMDSLSINKSNIIIFIKTFFNKYCYSKLNKKCVHHKIRPSI